MSEILGTNSIETHAKIDDLAIKLCDKNAKILLDEIPKATVEDTEVIVGRNNNEFI